MKLKELLAPFDYALTAADGTPVREAADVERALSTEVSDITNDSRKVTAGSLYFCIPGAVRDGHEFAAGALKDGASVLVVRRGFSLSEEEYASLAEACGPDRAAVAVLVAVDDCRYAMAFISAHFYGDPASRMRVIGVTGTKGKTTTTYLIRSALLKAGRNAGLIGTIETLYGDVRIPSANTTPESIVLQKTFRDMADAGVDTVVMEVSSQALKLHRTQGFVFDIGVFTNLSPDHIGPNEHDSFEEYLYCKSLLFRQCRHGIFNMDDPHAAAVLDGHTCDLFAYGIGSADRAGTQFTAVPDRCLIAKNADLFRDPSAPGISFDTEGAVAEHFTVSQPGRFSIYNALCAISVCCVLGIDPREIPAAIRNVKVKGRVEVLPAGSGYTLMIDYAHNAVALESLLTTLREYGPKRLVCLFGCGGNRSRERRFEMGEVSGRLADLTVITSDNPRNEEPMAIIEDIITGIRPTGGRYIEIPDRREAIRYVLKNAEEGDIIVLAGKGHEDYQEIRGVKYPMDERVIVREILKEEGII